MRVAGPLLTLSALLIAAPALAQGSGYYDPDGPYNWDRFGRYEYYPPPEYHMWRGPMHNGPMRYGEWRNSAQQSGSQSQQSSSAQPGQQGSSAPGPVSFATQSQIKSSLESSGFKNVTVLPQSFLIRATAPDGSRILMQVSADSLAGIVVNPTDQGTASSPGSTTSTNSSSGSASNTSGTSGTGGTSGAGNTSVGSGTPSTTGNTSSDGSSTGPTGPTERSTGR